MSRKRALSSLGSLTALLTALALTLLTVTQPELRWLTPIYALITLFEAAIYRLDQPLLSQYGHWLGFAPLTLVPISTEPVLVDELSRDQINWLNDYHAHVYEMLSPRLNEDEKVWLKEKCAAISGSWPCSRCWRCSFCPWPSSIT